MSPTGRMKITPQMQLDALRHGAWRDNPRPPVGMDYRRWGHRAQPTYIRNLNPSEAYCRTVYPWLFPDVGRVMPRLVLWPALARLERLPRSVNRWLTDAGLRLAARYVARIRRRGDTE